jgi:hypothetical protein
MADHLAELFLAPDATGAAPPSDGSDADCFFVSFHSQMGWIALEAVVIRCSAARTPI